MADLQRFPEAYIKQLLPLLKEEADAFFASYDQPALRGIRFRDARRPLPEEDIGQPIPYAINGYYLHADSLAGAMPLHEAGAYYIQEPSAMAAAAVLAPETGDKVLDLCAAPGGKSTQLAMMADLSLLVSNEPVPSRAQILSRNIERMGIANALVTCAYPAQLAEKWPGFFDKILVDAPCSGEGMFRRHPEAIQEWDADAPLRCHLRQLEILRAAACMLRPGGKLVFSTCTFNDTENEGTVRAFLQEQPHFELLPIHVPGLPEAPDGMLRLWPYLFAGEGHFVALLQKAVDAPAAKPIGNMPFKHPEASSLKLYQAFCNEVGCDIAANHEQNGRLYCVPTCTPPIDGIRIQRLGLHLGEARGKVFLPDHALSLAAPLQKTFELTDQQAALYQHGDTLPCGEDLRGFYVLTNQGYSLGFGKASGGQMKNHYPKGLRK